MFVYRICSNGLGTHLIRTVRHLHNRVKGGGDRKESCTFVILMTSIYAFATGNWPDSCPFTLVAIVSIMTKKKKKILT